MTKHRDVNKCRRKDKCKIAALTSKLTAGTKWPTSKRKKKRKKEEKKEKEKKEKKKYVWWKRRRKINFLQRRRFVIKTVNFKVPITFFIVGTSTNRAMPRNC